jgi:hypothetical protein
MNNLSPQQSDLIKSIKFANEFLKITRGFKTEADRPDGLPQDLKEHLANEHLNAMIKDHDLEPEMLVWGMLHMIEILLKFADLDPEDLTDVMDKFVEYVRANPDKYGGEMP